MPQQIVRLVIVLACGAALLPRPGIAESPMYEDTTVFVPYWIGEIPTGRFAGVSVDVAMPLDLSVYGSDDPVPFLEYVQVSLRSESGAMIPAQVKPDGLYPGFVLNADQVPQSSGFLIWTPIEPLQPGKVYQVHVLVDNLAIGCQSPCINLEGQFEIEVSASETSLPLAPLPIISDARLETDIIAPFFYTATCPDGLYICDESNICQTTFEYDWQEPTMYFSVQDGEAANENLFLYYDNFSDQLTASSWTNNNVNDILSNTKSMHFNFREFSDMYCVRTETIDLRSIFSNTVEQDRTSVIHCLPESERIPAANSNSYREQRARCVPLPEGATIVDTTAPTDTIDPTDTTNPTDVIDLVDTHEVPDPIEPAADTESADAATTPTHASDTATPQDTNNTDTSPSPQPDESTCSCKSTRRDHQSPFLAALWVLFAFVWGRRITRR